jgi:hypothetical protein
LIPSPEKEDEIMNRKAKNSRFYGTIPRDSLLAKAINALIVGPISSKMAQVALNAWPLEKLVGEGYVTVIGQGIGAYDRLALAHFAHGRYKVTAKGLKVPGVWNTETAGYVGQPAPSTILWGVELDEQPYRIRLLGEQDCVVEQKSGSEWTPLDDDAMCARIYMLAYLAARRHAGCVNP